MVSIIKSISFLLLPLLVFLFGQFLRFSFTLNEYSDWIFHDVQEEKTYDYIVVGAGSAGATVAAGLTDAGEQVLLIEAGGSSPFFADIPILTPMLQKSPYDWQYKTTPQEHSCRGLVNNASNWPRGKILGGSSRLHFMAYVEGHPEDYTDWFPDFNNYKKKKEFIADEITWCSELGDAVLQGISELSGREEYKNRLNGFRKVNVTMKNGERWSTDRLLTEERRRMGLDVITHAHVGKIIFSSNNKAEGVEFDKWGRKYFIRAKNGVVISAGAIGTPQLLMLSGIGPREHLEDFNIEVLNDLPVGKNLIDHIGTGLDLVIINTSLSMGPAEAIKPRSALNYFLFGEGPWTSAGLEIVGTLHTQLMKNLSRNPDVQLMAMPLAFSQDNGAILKKLAGIIDETFEEYFAPLAHKTAITLAPILLHPKSTGEIKLQNTNPTDDPLINPNYLSHEEDVSTLINGIKFIEELVNTESMKLLGAEMNGKKFPGCENHDYGTRSYWECYIRHLTLTSYHPAGTCRIGSVVDNNFRVYNTQDLYIVDASVMPVLPSGNPNAAIIMLANKALEGGLQKIPYPEFQVIPEKSMVTGTQFMPEKKFQLNHFMKIFQKKSEIQKFRGLGQDGHGKYMYKSVYLAPASPISKYFQKHQTRN